jgi:MOSC domain-containing protein YiiM
VDLSFRHDLWLRGLPRSPKDAGRVHRCVVRPQDGERLTPDAIELTLEGGIAGDSWSTSAHRRPTNQVSLMNVHVLRAVADGDEQRMALSGDNLQVDLDLSEENLPPGTQLAIGDAVIEVTDQPHTGCAKFSSRFGRDALRFVNARERKHLHLRGINAKVVRPGLIRAGDTVSKRVSGDASERAGART